MLIGSLKVTSMDETAVLVGLGTGAIEEMLRGGTTIVEVTDSPPWKIDPWPP